MSRKNCSILENPVTEIDRSLNAQIVYKLHFYVKIKHTNESTRQYDKNSKRF